MPGSFLRTFDAADAHDADRYGSSSSWLAAKAGMPKRAAKAAVRQMRQLRDRPLLDGALAAGDITGSLAFEIAGLDPQAAHAAMREETDRILLQAHAAGASLDDLAAIMRPARLRTGGQQQPDPDSPDDAFDDRFVQVGTTFGGAGVIRGDLTPECATAVRAVLEALGKKAGPEDERTEGKRFHDALQLACELLLRARLVPDRAGADTQAVVHIPLSQLRAMPGADHLEDAWVRARLGEDGYLTGKDAEAAACDAQAVPVVTAIMDPAIVDKMIDLARTTTEAAEPSTSRSPPGPAPRDRPPRHRLGIRPLRDRCHPPAGAARQTLEHPKPPPGHRLQPHHPRPHPPRRSAQRPRLRLAEMRPSRSPLRRPPPQAPG